MTNIYYVIGVITGIIIAAVLIIFAIRFCRGKGNFKSKYDERQNIAIGKAYRDGFWSLLAAGCAAMLLSQVKSLHEYNVMLMAIAAVIGLLVFIISRIMRDAYMGLNDNPKKWIVLLLIIGVLNLALSAYYILCGTGDIKAWPNLLAGTGVIIAAAAYIIRQQMLKKANREAEDGETDEESEA